MTPYYQKNNVTLYCGDCVEVMRKLPDNSIDAIITDPPYGLNDGSGKVSKRGNELQDFNAGDWDNSLPLEWINSASRLLIQGRWIVAWTDKLSVHAVWTTMQQNGLNPKNTFYWVKVNPPPQPRKNFASGIESAVLATKGAVNIWNGGGWLRNYIMCPLVTGSERTEHPTQKPVSVMALLVESLSNTNHLILDPFAGSGTTAIACIKTNRQFIGIEISEEYCELSVKRIEVAFAQPMLDLEVE